MQLAKPGAPLALVTRNPGTPGPGQVLLRVSACGVCRTDLHVVDGDLEWPGHPVVPGHEVVGAVVETGAGVDTLKTGDRIGVPRLGWICGECGYCSGGREKLCDRARFTGYGHDASYAEYAKPGRARADPPRHLGSVRGLRGSIPWGRLLASPSDRCGQARGGRTSSF